MDTSFRIILFAETIRIDLLTDTEQPEPFGPLLFKPGKQTTISAPISQRSALVVPEGCKGIAVQINANELIQALKLLNDELTAKGPEDVKNQP
jgi:hypothetical protein